MTDIKKINLNGTDYTLGGSSNGVTKALKKALIDIFENVAYVDGNGQQYFEALETALETKATALAVEPSSFASYTIGSTQQLTAVTTPTDALDELTWSSSNTDVATVDDTGLVTIIGYGSAVITVSTGTLSATCSVTVSQAVVTSIAAVFNQGTAKIYDSYELTELKQYLTVTANYDNGTSAVVSDYALSGTLAEGTSTVTVSYGGQTTTFTVIVSSNYLFNWDFTESLTDPVSGRTVALYGGASKGTPTQDSTGLHFTNDTQIAYLGKISAPNTTFEIDVASFSFAGDTSAHVRFLMNSNTNSASSPVGSGALIYRAGLGWSAYGYKSSNTTQTGSTYRTWSTTGWGDLYSDSTANMNFFSGKTVKLEFGAAHTMSLYVDDTLIGTMTDVYFNGDRTKYAFIGGLRTLTPSSGDQCFNMTITGIRVYANNV